MRHLIKSSANRMARRPRHHESRPHDVGICVEHFGVVVIRRFVSGHIASVAPQAAGADTAAPADIAS